MIEALLNEVDATVGLSFACFEQCRESGEKLFHG